MKNKIGLEIVCGIINGRINRFHKDLFRELILELGLIDDLFTFYFLNSKDDLKRMESILIHNYLSIKDDLKNINYKEFSQQELLLIAYLFNFPKGQLRYIYNFDIDRSSEYLNFFNNFNDSFKEYNCVYKYKNIKEFKDLILENDWNDSDD